MSNPDRSSDQKVDVLAALQDQQGTLARLLELYSYDFTELKNLPLGEDGCFGYKGLDLYWTDKNRHPFLVRVDGRLAGFALVRRGSEISGDEITWDMAEFFIVRGERRKGAGVIAAHKIWNRFPGAWEVRVMGRNRGAVEFWQRSISLFTNEENTPRPYKRGNETWYLHTFQSPTS